MEDAAEQSTWSPPKNEETMEDVDGVTSSKCLRILNPRLHQSETAQTSNVLQRVECKTFCQKLKFCQQNLPGLVAQNHGRCTEAEAEEDTPRPSDGWDLLRKERRGRFSTSPATCVQISIYRGLFVEKTAKALELREHGSGEGCQSV